MMQRVMYANGGRGRLGKVEQSPTYEGSWSRLASRKLLDPLDSVPFPTRWLVRGVPKQADREKGIIPVQTNSVKFL